MYVCIYMYTHNLSYKEVAVLLSCVMKSEDQADLRQPSKVKAVSSLG